MLLSYLLELYDLVEKTAMKTNVHLTKVKNDAVI